MNRVIILFVLLATTLISYKKEDKVELVVNSYCSSTNPKYQKITLLVVGQSNAANAGYEKYYAKCDKILNFYQGKYHQAKDPLQGANGITGCVWGRLATKLKENNFADTIIIAPAAIGATKIEAWIPGGEYHFFLDEAISYLEDANLPVDFVLYHQGESNNHYFNQDISPEENAESYKSNFYILTDYFRSRQVNCPILIAQATHCADATLDSLLNFTQKNLAADSLDIFAGPNTDSLGNEYRYDNCHFNAFGLDKHAEMWVDNLLQF